MSATAFAVLAAVVVGAALLQGITGFGFGLAATPVALTFLAPHLAIAIVTVLSSIALPPAVISDRRQLDRRAVSLMCAAAIPGLVLGLPLLLLGSSMAITLVAGLSSLGAAVGLATRPGRAFRNETLALGLSALLSGVLQGTCGLGGPPVVLTLTKQRWEVNRTRGTMAAFFVFVNGAFLAALAAEHALPDATWRLSAELTLPVIVGVGGGRRVALRLSERRRRWLNLLIVSASGGVAVVIVLRGLVAG